MNIFTYTLENSKRLILHTAIALTLTSGLSYIAGFMRDRVLAQKFGASTELDTYLAAFIVPDFILAVIVTSAIGSAFIPLFTQNWSKDEKRNIQKSNADPSVTASQYAYSILFFLLMITAFLVIIAMLLAPQIANFLVGSYTPKEKETYITLMQIMLFSPLIFTVSNIFGGVLLSTRDYFFYGIAPVFYNFGIIGGVYFLEPMWGIHGVALGTIVGALLHMLSRAVISVGRIGFTSGISRIQIWGNPQIKETVMLVAPKIFHIIAWQVLLLWFVRLAIEIQEGGVTIYSYARNFQSMPVSLIGIAIALSAFTSLSFAAASKDFVTFKKTLYQKMVLVTILTLLAALSLNALAPKLVSLLLEGGKFSEGAVEQTVFLLQVYVWSIPLESLLHLLARANYALKKILIPSIINVSCIALIIITSSFLAPSQGLSAIPYAFLGGLILQNILLYTSLKYYINNASQQS